MKNEKLWYKNPAKGFEEAIPIGNGSFGAMVYGDPSMDKISLNHDTLWSGTPKRTVKPSAYNAYITARDECIKGNIAQAEQLLMDNFHADWTQNYLSMGSLFIKSDDVVYEEYRRTLNMSNAVVDVAFESGRGNRKREYFASNPSDCIVIKYSDENVCSYDISFTSEVRHSCGIEGDKLIIKGECPSNLFPCDRYSENPCSYVGDSVNFTAIVKVVTDGEICCFSDHMMIKDAKETKLYIAVETSFIDHNMLPLKETRLACEEKIKKATMLGFDEVKQRHIEDFSNLYERTEIDLHTQVEDIPTDELLCAGENYPALAEKMFGFAKYLMISASRAGSQAMNLQGLWNEDFRPPWCSNYTMNINTEMNYWPMFALNLAELHNPLIELIKKLADTGTTTAREYYRAKGFVAHHATDLWGLSTACGPKAEKSCAWGFWNMSIAWLLHSAFERYEYTQDKEYLKEIFPLLKGAVEFYISMLIEDDEKMIMSPSTSPENWYLIKGEKFSLAKYTAMTQELLIELFQNCIRCCDILDTHFELKSELEEIVPLLNTFKVGSQGQLLEWDKEYEENDIHHRHISHLYGIYPAELFTEKKNKELYNAGKRSLEIRGDGGTGWSLAWKINLWAKFKEANHSYEVFKKQMTFVDGSINKDYKNKKTPTKVETVNVHGGTYSNLFDAHPPFQIDGNFGTVMGIIQWLIQCEDGVIKILPALPDELHSGSIRGIVAKGNIIINIIWENGQCVSCTARSPICQNAVFLINNDVYSVRIDDVEKEII